MEKFCDREDVFVRLSQCDQAVGRIIRPCSDEELVLLNDGTLRLFHTSKIMNRKEFDKKNKG